MHKAFKYKKNLYQPCFIDHINDKYNNLDIYTEQEFNNILGREMKNKIDIAININLLCEYLKLSKNEINQYLLWLYQKGSIILFSNGYANNFWDKHKNSDLNIKDIYLIRFSNLKYRKFLAAHDKFR